MVSPMKITGKLIRGKTLNLKTTLDLVTQDSYEKRHKQSTIPTALVKQKKTRTNTQNPEKLPNKQQHLYRKTTAKEERLQTLRTAKLDTTSQTPGKNNRML